MEEELSNVLQNCETVEELHSQVRNILTYVDSVLDDILEEQEWHEEYNALN